MAQWLCMFSGHTHSTLVSDRSELLSRAIANWNAVQSEERTSASRKKLLRLADDLLRAIVKEKKALLDRMILDKQSPQFRTKLAQLEELQQAGAANILKKMGITAWEAGEADASSDLPNLP